MLLTSFVTQEPILFRQYGFDFRQLNTGHSGYCVSAGGTMQVEGRQPLVILPGNLLVIQIRHLLETSGIVFSHRANYFFHSITNVIR